MPPLLNLVAAVVVLLGGILWGRGSFRSKSTPILDPIVRNDNHEKCVRHICHVYYDYLSVSSDTVIPSFYDIIGIAPGGTAGSGDSEALKASVMSALAAKLGPYYAASAMSTENPADDAEAGKEDSPGVWARLTGPRVSQPRDRDGMKDAPGSAGGSSTTHPRADDGEAARRQREVWVQISHVLADDTMCNIYDKFFMPILTSSVDAVSVLTKACGWDTY